MFAQTGAMNGILRNRAVLRAAGPDVSSFLQGIVTQDVAALAGGWAFSALLTPQGKILFDFFLAPAPEGFFLDCSAAAAPALLQRLLLYKLRAKVAIDAEPSLCVAIGADAGAFADPRLADLPRRRIAGREPDMADADEFYEQRRLALGVPQYTRDFDGEEVFLLDVNYDRLNAVSYQKGCFVGQEVTSRMKRKGEIRKRTLIARFDGPSPAKGAPILAGDTAIGAMSSAGEGVGLALLRLDRLREAEAEGLTPTCDGRALRISVPAYLEQR